MKTEKRVLESRAAARFHALSASPEMEAFARLETWAKSHDIWVPGKLLEPGPALEVYGYNNPDPSAGSPNYGYEFLVCGADLPEAPDMATLAGGAYLVAPFDGDDPMRLPEAWQALAKAGEEAGYRLGSHQWLERHYPPEFKVELYLPVRS